MEKSKEESFEVGDYIYFDDKLYGGRSSVRLKASDEQLEALEKVYLRKLLATGIKGNDYKKVMYYVLKK